jgi:hypothetical protein
VAWFSIGQPPGESAGQRSIQGRAGSHASPEKASTAAPATADGPGRFATSTSRFESGTHCSDTSSIHAEVIESKEQLDELNKQSKQTSKDMEDDTRLGENYKKKSITLVQKVRLAVGLAPLPDEKK